ncbi:MAG: M18 family aminopeptidase [Actinomycetaceae bacterium]|nr:M18 family aminopeptidase [Actinomycetaceae bacterium]
MIEYMNTIDPTHRNHATDFADFITASPSSYHAAHEVARRLEEGGFALVRETGKWPREAGKYYLLRDGAVVAWIVPDGGSARQARIVGSHTDSPTLKIKPSGSYYSPDGWGQIAVETYGGLLLNSWLDREIGFAGRVVDRQGKTHLVRTDAIARIPQLAIHLDRQINSDGLKLDPQTHMQPVWTLSEGECVLDEIARQAGLGGSEEIHGFDVVAYTTQEPQFLGAHKEFLAAGRQDNLSSVHAALVALLEAEPTGEDVLVFAAFDHEEIGSSTRSGAAGPLLADVLERISYALGLDRDGHYQFLAGSSCVSADAGHSVHPNYAQKHDPNTHPMLGAGTLLKLNANQRYASDAVGAALWARACQQAEVPTQEFVSNNSVPCGSTIGPITATRLGITTVDVGICLLSMHSAREMSHVSDHYWLSQALRAYYQGA